MMYIYISISEVGGGRGSQTSKLLHVMPCMPSGQAPISAGLAIFQPNYSQPPSHFRPDLAAWHCGCHIAITTIFPEEICGSRRCVIRGMISRSRVQLKEMCVFMSGRLFAHTPVNCIHLQEIAPSPSHSSIQCTYHTHTPFI